MASKNFKELVWSNKWKSFINRWKAFGDKLIIWWTLSQTSVS